MKIGEIAARLLHDAERPQTAAGMLESPSDNGQL
jgi:hypothetical protein